ncbi:uracil-xanthine permease family protein [Thermodesulfobacteriota bacterium]
MQFEYNLDQRVPFIKAFLFGLQWAALSISSIIILGKVVGGLHFGDSLGQIIYLQKLLFLSSVTLFGQIFWGHKLPLIPGPSAVLLVGVVASQGLGVSAIYSSIMIGGLFITVLAMSGLFSYFQRLFTTNVVAVVLLLITFTIAPTIQKLMIDAKSGINPFYNIIFALILIFMMFLFYQRLNGIWKSTLIIWAMIIGSFLYFLIFPAGTADDTFSDALWLSGFFKHMTLDFSFQPGVLISFIFCYIALAINDLGSIQSVNEILNSSDIGKRITRGISLTGLANILSGFFGVIGPVNYSISPGVIVSTRCASRFTLVPAAAIMFILSFLPAATGFIGNVPSVVIGAVLAYIMASQVAASLLVAFRGTQEEGFQFENGLVIGLSVLLGTIVAFLPTQVINSLHPFLRPVLGNGFVIGVISVLVLEHIIFRKKVVKTS